MHMLIKLILSKNYDSLVDILLDRKAMKTIGEYERGPISVSIRENIYLYKRQLSFVLIAVITGSILTLCLQVWFIPQEEIVRKYAGVGALACIYVLIWLVEIMDLTCVFNMKLWGYKGMMRWAWPINLVIVMFGAANLFCLFYKDVQVQAYILLIALLASLVLFAVMCFKVYVAPPKAIVSFAVSEESEHNKETFNGAEDISVNLLDGTCVPVNLFEGKLSIVEDKDLLVFTKDLYDVYPKESVKSIHLDNKLGFVIDVVFDGTNWTS